MAVAAIFDIQICEMLLADGVWRAQTHNCTKFGQNRIEFSRWPPPPSWILETAKFYWLLGSRGSRRICTPNFVKICQSTAKMLRFLNFSRWRPSPSWIFIFVKFYWLTVSGGPRHITVSNFVTNVIPLRRYCDFSNLQDGRRRHFGFLKSRNFVDYLDPEGWDASSCQILSKSVNRLWRYLDFSIFQDGGRRHLGFSNLWNFIGWRWLVGPDT